jgi:adenine C2-methylase RlmN of 23S rRNA A2503 and tRNA A37
MPINRKYSLEDVRDALLAWPRYSANKVCVEYVLIPGVNDTEEHARQIAEFMAPFGLCDANATSIGRDGATMVHRLNGTQIMAMLNLIPYNPRRNSPWPAPTEDQVDQFLNWLIVRGVFAKRRRTKGRQMMGACGQLGAAHIRQRTVVPLRVDARPS